METMKTLNSDSEFVCEKNEELEQLLAMVEEIAMVKCMKCDVN